MKHVFTRILRHTSMLLLLALITVPVFAQIFSVSPANDVNSTVYENGYGDIQIDLMNTSGSSLVFEWEIVSNTCNPNWYILLCDFPNCYSTLPATGTMDPVSDGMKAFLRLTVNPGSDLGIGTVTFDVWPSGNTAAKEQLTMTFDAVTGVADVSLAEKIEVYPNPVANTLFLRNVTEAGSVELIGLDGASVLKQAIPAASASEIDLANLPAGLYMLRLEVAGEMATRRIVKL